MVSEYAVRILAYLAILSTIGFLLPWYLAGKIVGYRNYFNECNTGQVSNFVPVLVLVVFWALIGVTPRGHGYVNAGLIGMVGLLAIRYFLFRQKVSVLEIFAYFSIVMLSTRWIWWKKTVFNTNELVPLLIAAVVVTGLAVTSKIDFSVGKRRFAIYLTAIITVAAIVFYFTSTASLIGHDTFGLWHHVSAYVGPAELVAKGVVPLVDIALQYGAGYAWLASSFGCSTDCWSAIVWSQHLTNLVWAGALAMACFLAPVKWTSKLLLFAVIGWGASVALLTNYPPDLLPALGIPSTKGIRFWPLSVMAALVLAGSRYNWFNKKYSAGRIAGHCVWIGAIAWSPEAGLQTGIVWAGALQWSAVRNDNSYIASIMTTVIELLIVLLIGGLLLWAIFWSIFGQSPDLGLYFLYLSIPWGEVNVDFGGATIFIVAFYVISGLELRKRILLDPKGWDTTSLYLGILIATMGLSYFVNRPHDNNFLNIFLFFLPAVITLAGDSRYLLFKHTFFWCLVMPIVWAPYYGAASFNRYLARDVKYEKKLSNAWSLTNPDNVTPKLIMSRDRNSESFEELVELARKIKSFGDSYAIVDSRNFTDGDTSIPAWSAFRNASPWVFLRPDDRRAAIGNVAKKLKADGWLIVQRGEFWFYNDIYSDEEMFADFDRFYQRERSIETKFYRAVKYHYAGG